MRTWHGLVLLLACACAGHALADSAAPAAKTLNINYVVSRNGFDIGQSHGILSQKDNGRFHFRREVNTTGVLVWLFKDKIIEQSEWKQTEQGIRPLSYSYSQTGGKRERHVELKFNWDQGRVENIIDKDAWRMDIPPGTLDKLVVQFAMMLDLQAGKREMTYAIADGGKLKRYHFRAVGEEVLQTPAGSYRTLKMERVRDNNKRATYLWCAPDLNYLPVRVDQREDDDESFRMLLKQYSGF